MTTVEDILLKKGSDVIAALPETSIRHAAQRMAEANVGCLIVEHHGVIIGIFSERDLLQRVVGAGRDLDKTVLMEVMTSPVMTCQPEDNIFDVTDKFWHHDFRHLLVVDRDCPIGVISMRDLTMELRKQTNRLAKAFQ